MVFTRRADAHAPTTFGLDARIEAAFAIHPTPSEVATIDRRVAAAIAAPRPAARRIARPRHLRRVVLLAAALVVLGGAGATLVSLYSGIGSGGYRVAWERATKLGLAQVNDGYRVTLEAAYADPAQTMLAISILDTEPGRSAGVDLRGADLADEAGRTYRITSGGSTPADGSSSINTAWYETPGDGTLVGTHHYVLTVTEIGVRDPAAAITVAPSSGTSVDPWHAVAGPWRFEFDLAITPGTRLTPATSVTSGGITATLESILVTPTTARVVLRYDGLPMTGSAWASIATIEHNGARIPVGTTGSTGTAAVQDVINTVSGTDDASGSWVVRIDELVGGGPDGQVRIAGPWELRFTAP